MPKPAYIQPSMTYGVMVVFLRRPVIMARDGSMEATDHPFTHLALNRSLSSLRIYPMSSLMSSGTWTFDFFTLAFSTTTESIVG